MNRKNEKKPTKNSKNLILSFKNNAKNFKTVLKICRVNYWPNNKTVKIKGLKMSISMHLINI